MPKIVSSTANDATGVPNARLVRASAPAPDGGANRSAKLERLAHALGRLAAQHAVDAAGVERTVQGVEDRT